MTTRITITISLSDDEVLMTDGPFVDSKEQIARFYVIDCDDLDDAISWASKIPGARAIDIRSLRERS